MGQYWQLINIDKRQTTGHLGKLGEFFFSDIGLLHFLSPPYREGSMRGTWAGDRLICIGDYAYDCPKGVLTTKEIDEINDDKEIIGIVSDSSVDKVELYSFAGDAYNECQCYKASQSDYPENGAWVLRNLSKQEYVLADAFKEEGATDHVKLSSRPGLTQAMLSRICWSNDPSCSMCIDYDWTRGPWAGDRFDIQPFDDVKEELQVGWKDISEEVVKPVLQEYEEY